MSGPDPAARALSWVQATLGDRPMPPTAVVIGIGDGAVLTALNRMRSGVRILVVEPDEAAAAAFMASEGYRRRAADERLLCLGGPDYRGADQAWRLYPANPDDHLLLISPEAVRDRPRVRAAAHVVGKILFGARANAEARRQFAPRYLANSLANLPSIARGSSVAALSGAFAGRPVVVVGAGPSLDTALPDLVVLQDRAIVIATDTALRPLLHAGVAPHLVVGADPSARNARHFFGLPPCPRTWLVAESALDPDAAAIFAGRTFWFRLAHHDPWPWYQELGIDAAHVDMWGSVLTAAFQIALLGGGDPIAFIGADLAYTGGRPYARGTTYEFDWAYTAALGVGLDEAWRQQIALTERVTAASVAGTPVETSLPLQVFRDWLAARVPACGRRVLNATGGGILAGDGITQTTLRAALGAAPPLTPPAWARVATTTTPLARLAEAVDEARRAVRSRPATDALVRAWTEFSGGVFDGAAVDGALARAEAALRHDGQVNR
ncbi:MAG TPA: 6-hydroxymethylpterin diphosphokinase MptE-like protein, partial [Vicinamibacterales bacterium]|nr:6-hydroxymethylpterin diphosphokinase MptE-like protein [Vicinamibacterales bacterium]